jgi:hypothetical protein
MPGSKFHILPLSVQKVKAAAPPHRRTKRIEFALVIFS